MTSRNKPFSAKLRTAISSANFALLSAGDEMAYVQNFMSPKIPYFFQTHLYK